MLNRATLLGRLGRDPEVRHIPSGTQVANFSLATDERYKDKGGEWKSRTEWIPIVAWGNLAENCAKYLRKGSLAFIEGKIQTRQWEKNGAKHYRTEVVASMVKFLSKNEEQGGGGGGDNYDYNQEAPVDEDSIPF